MQRDPIVPLLMMGRNNHRPEAKAAMVNKKYEQ
jgi:hypothetical protein